MNKIRNHPAYHLPVLLDSLINRISPISGIWIDGTFGAGGYTKALLKFGAERVIAVDKDPRCVKMASQWRDKYKNRLEVVEGNFGDLPKIISQFGKVSISGIVLDIGVSSMQIDQAERGFSFQKDGPLDMRMSSKGISAKDVVNYASEEVLADIFFYYGEERAARTISRAIIKERKNRDISRTLQLAEIIEKAVHRKRYTKINPATRSFQALRIAVNNELEDLSKFLMATEQLLPKDGLLAIVSFHSLEDRLIKNFINSRSGKNLQKSRYWPEALKLSSTFETLTKKVLRPSVQELEKNYRARSAKLRIARRLAGPPNKDEMFKINTPNIEFNLEKNE